VLCYILFKLANWSNFPTAQVLASSGQQDHGLLLVTTIHTLQRECCLGFFNVASNLGLQRIFDRRLLLVGRFRRTVNISGDWVSFCLW
jgi:hypothetical protein